MIALTHEIKLVAKIKLIAVNGQEGTDNLVGSAPNDKLALKSGFGRKDYALAAFLSCELSPPDSKYKNKCLDKRRVLINEHEFDRKDFRF